MTGINGSGGNKQENDKPGKIIQFRLPQENNKQPALAKNNPPFFNVGQIPPFTKYLALLLVLIHGVLFITLDAATRLQVFYMFGFVPAYFTGAAPMPNEAWLSPLTHMLLHGGWAHVGFNLVMVLALGTFFERLYGAQKTALFLGLCGFAGALAFFLLNPGALIPLIGISGSISGLFAAYLLHAWRQGQLGRGRFGPWPLLGFWVLFMIGSAMLTGGNIAWQSHIGGFAAGAFLIAGPGRKWLKL